MDDQMIEQIEDEAREVDEMIFLCKDPDQRKQFERQYHQLNQRYLDAHNIH